MLGRAGPSPRTSTLASCLPSRRAEAVRETARAAAMRRPHQCWKRHQPVGEDAQHTKAPGKLSPEGSRDWSDFIPRVRAEWG